MKRLLVCVLLLGCFGTARADFWGTADKLITGGQRVKEQLPPPAPDDQSAPSSDNEGSAPSQGEDRHYIQADDYFTQQYGMEGRAWIWVELAKMVTSPSSSTKGEAEFMKIKDGKNSWTRHFWQTRAASQKELKLGMLVIAFNDNHHNDIYDAPARKDRARGGSWFMARITDTSDLYKGYVTVSGNYKVSPRNIRVLVGR